MFFSIVIANYNYGQFLEKAIRSVLSQECDDFELIIVDGGSTDNSLEIIKKYESKIAWRCSEKDSGQSEAFNKGFLHAKGKFLTWLNADDLMLPGTLQKVKKALIAHPNVSWAVGNVIRFNHHTNKIIEVAWGPHYVPSIFQGKKYPICVYGPTSFWSKEAYDKVGPMNEKIHYTMDYDYWRRLTAAGYKYIRVNHTCWAFRMHESSKTAEFDGHKRSEARKANMIQERERSERETGCRVSAKGRLVKQILRILDLSVVVYFFRKIFVLGKDIRKIYKVEV